MKNILLFLFLAFGIAWSSVSEKIIFPNFIDPKTQVVVGEIFEVNLEVMVLSDYINSVSTSLKGGNEYKIYNPRSRWKKTKRNTFRNRYYIKLKSTESKLPAFNIKVSIKDEIKTYIDDGLGFDEEFSQKKSYTNLRLTKNVVYPDLRVIELSDIENFSNVIARELALKSQISKKYDDKNNIVLLDIEANLSNLEDFNLSNGGISSKEKKLFNSKVSYYEIIPDFKDSLEFNYFNTKKNTFENIKVEINIGKDTLSTQTELNPKTNKYILYKKVSFVVLFVLFLIIFLIKRKIIFLLILLILSVIIFINFKPYDIVTIKLNAPVKILPTKNSTIMYYMDEKNEVQKLLSQNNHVKVLLPNKKIGWIKNENIIKTKSFFDIN
ncbi:MAG: Unknown protein [uncultured Campylobacterales bacterium]|uniref:Periplasmic protein n=1 Tax=uncultured Campylobacterales bacterium TaxID=352960 RepID=A0A6S6SVJ8_9BACT|nr:MAG: Unknown protein [uncultured Campylobacterales bacterium]